jgi:thioredoxin reductase
VAGVADELPFPPGRYGIVVVGSGPGGLQTSYCLTRLGVDHAVLSRDDAPGGMFRLWPIFERLLSWTKVEAPFERGTREYEWYDHNSLVAEEREHQALVADIVDRSFIVPSRDEMERGMALFADRAGVAVRYGCEWQSTRLEEDELVLTTSDGEYRCRAAVFALGVTEPWRPTIPGLEDVPHYADTSRPRDYAGKDVVIVGKRNSGFELADGLLPWARRIFVVSPRTVTTEVLALASVRARYLQPYEDWGLGGGTFSVDAAIERVERVGDRWLVRGNGTTTPGAVELPADVVIAATGFGTPLRDLPALGVATVGQGRIPALTPLWRSTFVDRVYFAGNATQGAAGLRRHGVGSSSPAVHGFRYNARILAEHLARKYFGIERPRRALAPPDVVPFLLRELAVAPELWTQKGYLARAVALEPGGGWRDGGIVPLEHFVDAGPADGVAVAVEMDSRGRIFPGVYTRRHGRLDATDLPGELLHRFESDDHRAALERLLRPFAS